MGSTRLCATLAIALAATASASAAAAQSADCAATDLLLRQARTDFPALRQKKMAPGKCSFRDSEYKCEWTFTGDAFAVSDAEAAKLTQCIAAHPSAQQTGAKGGGKAFSLDPDLTVLVRGPEVDEDGWKVSLRIRSAYQAR